MGHIEGEYIQHVDPRTGEGAGSTPVTPTQDIPRICVAARTAQTGWADTPLSERKAAVARLRQGFLEHAEQLVALLAAECGRPAGEAWTSEIVANDELFGFWLSEIDDLLTATPIQLNPINYPSKRGVVRLEPKGVLGLITPWNLPIAIPLRALVPAVLAGNAVVWKGSEHTPQISALLADLCAKALPEHVVSLVQGGAAQGESIVTGGVDAVFFTGSVRTGRAVQVQAATAGIATALELGGKDAALVLPDANLDRAAHGITWAAFGFAGQNCAAVERCFVHETVYEDFVDAVVKHTHALRPMQDVGPLVTRAQLNTVSAQLDQAVSEGAVIAAGGSAQGPGNYHPPTVLTDVPSTATVLTEETFGPLLPILPYTDLEDAIAAVNNTPFGLTTSVWTRDKALGETLADSFECGVVTVNNHSFTGALASAAWTGVGDSGSGVTNSRFSLYEMTRPKTIVIDGSGQREMWWYPYNDALLQVTQNLVELSRGAPNRLAALFKLISGLKNRWKESP